MPKYVGKKTGCSNSGSYAGSLDGNSLPCCPMCSLFFIAWLLVRMLNPLVSAVCRRIRIKREAAGAVILTGFFSSGRGGSLVFDRRPFRSGQPVLPPGLKGTAGKRAGLWTTAAPAGAAPGAGRRDRSARRRTGRLRWAAEHIEGKLAPDLLNHSFQYLTKLAQWAGFLFIIFIGGDSADAGL